MFDHLLNIKQKKLREEVLDFVKSIPKKMILDMDADKIQCGPGPMKSCP